MRYDSLPQPPLLPDCPHCGSKNTSHDVDYGTEGGRVMSSHCNDCGRDY